MKSLSRFLEFYREEDVVVTVFAWTAKMFIVQNILSHFHAKCSFTLPPVSSFAFIFGQLYIKSRRACKMVQHLKVFAIESDHVISLPGTHMVESKNWLSKVVLGSPISQCGIQTCMCPPPASNYHWLNKCDKLLYFYLYVPYVCRYPRRPQEGTSYTGTELKLLDLGAGT